MNVKLGFGNAEEKLLEIDFAILGCGGGINLAPHKDTVSSCLVLVKYSIQGWDVTLQLYSLDHYCRFFAVLQSCVPG